MYDVSVTAFSDVVCAYVCVCLCVPVYVYVCVSKHARLIFIIYK
jgi:hypothetical protein